MDETIDLRPYVTALVRHLWLIGGAVVAAIALALLLYSTSNEFEARAMVTVPEPSQQLAFDPRIVDIVRPALLLNAYPELAMSDDILARLQERASEATGGAIASRGQLRGLLDVQQAADARLLYLHVRHEDPEVASLLANAWAEEFLAAIERVYGTGGTDFYRQQLTQADQTLRAAEEALVAFQTTNRQGIVDNELAALTDLQRAYLADQNTLNLVLDNIRTLRVQLETNGSDVVSLADQLSALIIQLKAYETQSVSQTPVPPQQSLQLNIGSDMQLTATQPAEQLQRLEALRAAVEGALAQRQEQLDALQPRIFALQTEKQQLFNQGDRLVRARDIAQETYTTLSRKIDEGRIASEKTIARLASRASVPEHPSRPNLVVLLPLLVTAAVLLTAGLIIAHTWWREARKNSAAS